MSPQKFPERRLSVSDGVAILVGTVVGSGIFSLPAVVAANAGDGTTFLMFWVAGGLVALVGALCYAELATTEADVGGEYSFLARGWGPSVAFLFAWARVAVVQTGAIALVGFLYGDYAQALLPLGPYGPSIHAALAVMALTALNMAGAVAGAGAQKAMVALLVLALLVLAGAGLALGGGGTVSPTPAAGRETVAGLAMVLVLLTYSGWNEAAYIAGELRDVRRSMLRVLLVGVGVVTLLYLAVNAAYLNVLGLEGLGKSSTPAADAAAAALGPGAGFAMSLVVLLAMLTTMNAAIFTGARATYALGRDFPRLGWLGRWGGQSGAPVTALLAQGAVSLALVAAGTAARDGVSAMVGYTSPVFWLFMLLVGLSLFRIRRQGVVPAFKVPFYPVTPALFCAVCAYMVYASVMHTGTGALVGLAVLALGLPLLLWVRAGEGRVPVPSGLRGRG